MGVGVGTRWAVLQLSSCPRHRGVLLPGMLLLITIALWSLLLLGHYLSLSPPSFISSLLIGSELASTLCAPAASNGLTPASHLTFPSIAPPTLSLPHPSSSSSSSPHPPPRLVTVVTAFWPPGHTPLDRGKHGLYRFLGWFDNFFTFSFHNAPLYVFTSAAFYPRLAWYRYKIAFEQLSPDDFPAHLANNMTHLANRTLKAGWLFSELQSGAQLGCYWDLTYDSPLDTPVIKPVAATLHDRQMALDEERAIHSPLLYAVWNSKPFFVNHSATVNVWRTPYFMWIDAGSMRNDSWRLPHWPNERLWRHVFESPGPMVVNRQKERWAITRDFPLNITKQSERRAGAIAGGKGHATILYGALGRHPFNGHLIDRRYYCDVNFSVVRPPLFGAAKPIWIKQEARTEFVQGTFWAGSIESVQWYARMYYDTIYEYARRDWFMGDEQHVMNALPLAYPQHFRFYHIYHWGWERGLGDPWFTMPVFFAAPDTLQQHFTWLPPFLVDPDEMISDATTMCFD